MKKLVFVAASLLAFVSSPAAPAAPDPASEPLPVATFKDLEAGQKRAVVVYGTSLTIGGAWAKSLGEYWEKHYPGLVDFSNAAKSGMTSAWGVENLEARVLARKPDLVFIEFSANDAATKHSISLERSIANLDSMIQALRQQNPRVEIVLQTMNPAWDSPRTPEKKYGSDRPNLEVYYSAYRDYAAKNKLTLVDNYPAWRALQDADLARFQDMVPDGIHPSSTASIAVTWANVEALLERARAAAKARP